MRKQQQYIRFLYPGSSLYPMSLFGSCFGLKQGTSIELSSGFGDPIQWMPGSSQFRREVALRLWNFSLDRTPSPYTALTLDAYFRYQNEQADLFMHDSGQHVFVRTHQHVAEISQILKEDLDYTQALEKIRLLVFQNKGHIHDKALSASLDLVIRSLLMTEVGSIPNGFSSNTPWAWNQGRLSHFLEERFTPRPTSTQEWVRLGRVFTARNIERIAGIKIKWTSNLADHLQMYDTEEGELVVDIFHHASFLVMLQKRYACALAPNKLGAN
jgi:hypothetical protein